MDFQRRRRPQDCSRVHQGTKRSSREVWGGIEVQVDRNAPSTPATCRPLARNLGYSRLPSQEISTPIHGRKRQDSMEIAIRSPQRVATQPRKKCGWSEQPGIKNDALLRQSHERISATSLATM